MPADPGERVPLSRLGVALLSGAVVAFSMPPWGWWPLAVIGVIGFELALRDDLTRWWRARLGFAFGFAWMMIGMGWMWFLTPPGYIVTAALFAGFHAAAAAVAPPGRWRVIARPAAHTIAEAVRMLVPFGGVPLATLGISQADGPLLGVAGVGGVILLTWLVFQLSFALAAVGAELAWDRRFDRSRQRRPVAALAAVGFVIVLSALAPSGRDRGESLTIAAVQGGGEQGTSALDVPSSRVTQAHLDATATIDPGDDLDLVVWPENGVDVNGGTFTDSEAFSAINREVERLGVPFAVGVTLDSEFSAYPSADSFVNAQYVIEPGNGVTSGYEKVRIVPFGEYVPFRGVLEALGAPLEQIASDATRGRDPALLTLSDGTQLGVMISWEVFFGDRGRAADDSAILLNPTNGASYTGTILQTQQVASSRLRAMETGRWVVQVSPTGFSAFVSPDGDVFQRTDVSERRVITMAVPLRDGTTWYSTIGDWPWIIALFATLGTTIWLSGGLHRRRR